MKPADRGSLLDNPGFLDELVELEALRPDNAIELTPASDAAQAGVDPFPYASSSTSQHEIGSGGPQFMMPPPASEPLERAVTASPPAMGVMAFLLIVSLGAGASAFVFHDRVARIVIEWNSVAHQPR
jgi:hypothetical protein